MIAASGATQIPQLMRLVPGFLSFSSKANQLGVSSRALSPDFPGHLEVMVNGRSVYQPALLTVVWTSLGIALEDIDYIEVIRGSNTPAYGSNAFQGSINIVTLDPLTGSQSSVRATAGSIDTKNFSGRSLGSVGDFSYAVSLLSNRNSGFKGLSEPPRKLFPTQSRVDDLHTTQLRVQGLYTPSLDDEIDVTLGLGRDHLKLPESDVRGYHNRQFNSHYQHIRWKHLLDSGDVTTSFYHNYLSIEDDTSYGLLSANVEVSPSDVPLGYPGQVDEVISGDIQDGLSERYHLEVQHTFNASSQLKMVWGSAFRVDRLGSRFLLGHDQVIDAEQYQLFANADWQFLPRWNANVGVMLETNNLVGSFASPRLGVNYQIFDNHMLRMSATAARRTPSLLSVHQKTAVTFADGTPIEKMIGNTGEASEEKINVLELGYLGSFLQGDLTLDMKLFKEQLRDARYDADPAADDTSGFSRVWRNGLNWDTEGAEMQLRYQPDSQWLASLQYAYIDIDGFFPNENSHKDFGNQIPTHNVSLLTAYRPLPGWELSGVLYHTSEMKWTSGNDVDEITRLDLRLAKSFALGDWQGQLEFLIHNVDDAYIDYDKDNIFERRFFVRLKFDLE